MRKTQVLIVGAGPTGLMMACQLTLLDIPFRIIEKNSGPTTQSRALGVQARTLETYEQLGIADTAVKQGLRVTGVNYIAGKIRRHIPIANMGEGLSAFPYLLILEQSKNEELLLDFLERHNKKVEWETTLLSLSQTKDSVSTVIQKGEHKETLTIDYLADCEGARSVVRHALSIPLKGATYKQLLYVLDCKVEAPFKDDEVYLSFEHETFVAFFPLGHGKWRVIGVLPSYITDKSEATFEDIKNHFKENTDIKAALSEPNWLSAYHSHHRCVENFRAGRCFLVGDAAHIHSPVGAQGMNTGLEDASNLAWKLAFVLQNKAKEGILDSYNEERLPFAKRLVTTTDRIFSLVVGKNIFEVVFTRIIAPTVIQNALKHTFSRSLMFKTISQTGVNYPHSQLSTDATNGAFSKNTPKPGDRLPYALIDLGKKDNIQDMVTPVKFHLFVFSGKNTIPQDIYEAIQPYAESIDVTTIAYDRNSTLYKKFGIKTSGYYLVRPDMYIAYKSANMDTSHFAKYLSRFLV